MFRKNEFIVLNEMLDLAINGEFEEKLFDETELSKFQTKFMRYLTNSSMSEKKISEEKNKLKQLITDISHQTKTPLTNIVMYSELLCEIVEDSKIKDYASEISLHSKKLEELINALTKMSRLEGGIFQFKESDVSLAQIITSVVNQAYSKASCKNIKIDIEVDSDTMVKVDEKWMVEAIFNILDNAIKYSEDNTRIKIKTFCYEMFCGISIMDQGLGISEYEIPKIFSRFYRGTLVGSTEGIGVGLFLSRNIIERHGGYIKVKSKVGVGSTFSIYFPILSKVKD
ncbi:sensor histidine kinase [Facklamia miroungae]|uniref:histidine kinase n=1 Tax=Facklamia miroungae TaxID=120956 RepID=A0A1G7T852_9LACT|nr:HAMP domain-containing sensor histidine kinase [Facklamia miroungae]NKZ29698.1 HAMP domain-containing histidine kinase [Facklamia miroungae]SDG31204.1 His Kinase A (phospho-acceptor) domain-containing protein [Facklamia miroungae]